MGKRAVQAPETMYAVKKFPATVTNCALFQDHRMGTG
jgi:hypothetical protein